MLGAARLSAIGRGHRAAVLRIFRPRPLLLARLEAVLGPAMDDNRYIGEING
jgi:hypothetical protein